MKTQSSRAIAGSVVVVMAIALVWFKAPVLPVMLGAFGAGLLMYLRGRRAAA